MNIAEIYKRFPEDSDCLVHIEKARWRGRPACPYCKSPKVTSVPKEKRHHCNNCNTSFSVTVGTIFHHTHLPLQKWFLAITLILNAKKGMSSRQLARDLGVNKNTAWYLAMRIRKAMVEPEQREMLQGIVEMDEVYIGGKPRKGNGPEGGKNIPPRKRGRGTSKIPVVGMIERGGKVKAKVVRKRQLRAKSLRELVRESVDLSNTMVITDEYRGYLGISKIVEHKTIDHGMWYVDGNIHTNSIESFWALLKRGIVGQYHKVSLRHLPRYIDEFCFRHNNRKHSDIFEFTIARGLGAK